MELSKSPRVARVVSIAVSVMALLAAAPYAGAARADQGEQSPSQSSTVTPGGLTTEPPVDGQVLNAAPQYIAVPGADPSDLVLTDATGLRIAGTTGDTSRGLKLPALLPGDYTLTDGRKTAHFAISGPGGALAGQGWATDPDSFPVWPEYLLGAAMLAAGAAAAYRRRLPAAAALVVAGLCIPAAAYALPNDAPEPRTIAQCGPVDAPSTPAMEECRIERATWLLRHGDIKKVADEMSELSACHELGHEVGRRAFVIVRDVSALIDLEKAFCTEGYLHGLMYGATMYLTDEEYREFTHGFCARIPDVEGLSRGSCVHGVGHGWQVRTNGDRQRGWDECLAEFPEQGPHQRECHGAVLMEHIHVLQTAQDRPEWTPEGATNPAALCSQVPLENVEWCYTGIALARGWTPGGEDAYASEMTALCSAMAEQDRAVECLRGVVRSFPRALGGSPQGASHCTALPAGLLRDVCAESYAYHYAYNQLSTKGIDEVCTAAQVAPAVCQRPGVVPDPVAAMEAARP